MPNIQKQTYLDLITTSPFADDRFAAKSITLDFLYGFDNPCTAIVHLNECLCHNNFIASMKFNGFLGVLLAVEEYKHFYSTVIVHRFLLAVIEYIINKSDDYVLDNYVECMKRFIRFIGDNINFKLLANYLDMGEHLTYSKELNNNNVKEVFNYYCEVLMDACNILRAKNPSLLDYKLSLYKNKYKMKIEENQENHKIEMLTEVYKILNNIDPNKVIIVSNVKEKGAELVNKLRRDHRYLDAQLIEKEKIRETIFNVNEKVIFIIDLKENDSCEMIYLLGRIEEMVSKNHLLALFYDNKEAEKNTFYSELISRYSDSNNFEDRLKTLLKAE